MALPRPFPCEIGCGSGLPDATTGLQVDRGFPFCLCRDRLVPVRLWIPGGLAHGALARVPASGPESGASLLPQGPVRRVGPGLPGVRAL